MYSPTNLSLTGVTGGYILNGLCQVSGSTLTNGQTYVYSGQNQNRTVYYRQ